MRSVRDIAVVYRGLLSDLQVRDVALVGLGFSGWIAAELFDRPQGWPNDRSRVIAGRAAAVATLSASRPFHLSLHS